MDQIVIKQYKNDAILIKKGSKIDHFFNFFEQKLNEWKCFSLVSKNTLNDVFGWHFIEALSIVKLLKDHVNNLKIVDFGAGSGVIGITLYEFGFHNMQTIERSSNKIFFMKEVMKFLNVFDKFDSYENCLVIIRGVTDLLSLLRKLLHAQKLILFKSLSVKKEIHEALKFFDFKWSLYDRIGNAQGFIVLIEEISIKR